MGNITMLDLNRTVFIPCDCKNEILVIDYDHTLNTADVAIYENMSSLLHQLSLWQRIRYAVRTLIYGRPYGDQLILNTKQLRDLKAFLSTIDL